LATEPLSTRLVRFEDVPEILRLIRRAIEQGCRSHYDRRQREVVYASYAGNLFVEALGPLVTVVADGAGGPIAVAQLDPSAGRLRALFVDAGSQQRGLGRALLADVEARALGRGCRRLHGAMSLNAVRFYRAAGFLPCAGPETLTSATGVPIPIVRMEKALR
jgi:GNAT superfamily N-acetyltransferase